jgi:hypothetical protein
MEKPTLHSAKFVFSQEGNTCGTTEEYEELEIELDAPSTIDGPDDCFFVIRTTTGWSMDSLDELKELIDKCKKAL